MNICEHLSTTAGVLPDAVALQFESDVWSYRHLDELSRRSAHVLHEAGVRPGDRVALMLANVPAFPVWYYAALRLGAIAVSVSTRSAATEVAFVMSDSGAGVLICDQATQQVVGTELGDEIRTIVASDCGRQIAGRPLDGQAYDDCHDASPDDPALILYTSGTTGFPKGATLSHGNVRSNVCAFNHLCDMQPTDRVLLSVPLFHCFGQNALLNSVLNVGGTLVLQRRFDLNEARRLIAAHSVTQLYGVPMMFQLFADSCEAGELKGVRYCFSAAAPLPIQTSERWQAKFGQPIYEGYGLTETSPFASYNHRYAFTPGSIGVPIDNVEMKIVDTQTGADCPAGELGEIAVRGPNVMLGYWGRPEETKAAIRDGWFHSGDIGRQDERGCFYIVDRVKDMIAVGGLKVYPAEVERVLRDHRAVAQVAVVGIPDAVFGEQVVAFVVPEHGLLSEDDLRDIQQHARQNLANYKVPRVVVSLEELPRNPSGKVLKTQLRTYSLEDSVRLESEGQEDATAQSQLREPTLRKTLLATHAVSRRAACIEFVQHLVQHVADTESLLDPDTRLLDAGLDSLMLVEISNQIQVEVGPDVPVAATLVFDQPRISDLGEYLLATILPEDGVSEDHPPAVGGDVAERTADNETLHQQVAELSEEQALAELMKELSDS